jgi:hypothetical protein
VTHLRKSFLKIATRLERGDVGEDFAYSAQLPVMVSLFVIGIMAAMVGFWRMGAFQGGERGAFTSATAPIDGVDSGRSAAAEFFNAWANGTPLPENSISNLVRQPALRSSSSTISTTTSVDWAGSGSSFQFVVSGQSVKRWERFYSGPPVCSGGVCSE